MGGDLDLEASDIAVGDSTADVDAQGPETDMNRPQLRDAELLFALRRDAGSTMFALGYNAARDAMYAPGGIDDQAGRIEGIYTGRTVDTDGSRTPSTNCALADGTPRGCAFNTEHIVPRVDLRAAFGDGTPEYDAAEGDLHHLFPSEELANNARANFPFGETDCAAAGNCAFDERSQLGLPVGGTGRTSCPMGVDPGEDLCVMQLRPERRGDVARAVFYMSMRYELALPEANESTLRRWHAADAPDALEQARNAAVERAQGNRNPFVDDPALTDRIANF